MPPVGLAYVAAAIKSAGHELTVIDAVGEGLDQIRRIWGTGMQVYGISVPEILSRIPTDVEMIGVSCMFSSEWFYHQYLIEEIRRAFPKVVIVVGGEHATAEWKNILRVCGAVDYCVLGEGESTIVELARTIQIGADPRLVPGVSGRHAGVPTQGPPRQRSATLDALARPAWDDFPIQNYLRCGYSVTSTNRPAIPVVATRGCPFRCSFCTAADMWGQEMSLRRPSDVVDEIEHYVDKYEIKHIELMDIAGFINKKWTKDFLRELIDRRLPISWLHTAGTRSELLEEDVLRACKDSGVLKILYAPESGSKETLRRIQKRVDLSRLVASMKMANRVGISMRAPLLFGFPGQTMREAFENVFFAFKMVLIGVDDIVVSAFTAYPGSENYRDLVKRGKIDIESIVASGKYGEFLSGTRTNRLSGHRSWSEHIPSWTLPFFQLGIMGSTQLLRIILRPSRLFASVKRVLWDRRPLTLPEYAVYRLLKLEWLKSLLNPPPFDGWRPSLENSTRTLGAPAERLTSKRNAL